MKRVGADIGGTFTDLVVYDESTGELVRTKASTTPDALEEGVLAACQKVGLRMEDASSFIHGTTVVTNLLLERTGAKVGLISTKGFRDSLEIQRSAHPNPFDLLWEKPKPLVPRNLRVEVDQRILASGDILKPLDEEEVEKVVRYLLAQGVEAIAVCLIHSYVNPTHEQAIGEIIHRLSPMTLVSLSSVVDPRIREFERVSTTVVNAYAMPRTSWYVDRLGTRLGTDILYMHSGGGVLDASVAKQLPIALAYSGPAAGVLAGSFLGELTNTPNIITLDMGGTSTDVCVIQNGKPVTKDLIEVQWGIPVRTISLDVNAIGAGGGSIAWIDEGSALRVGPASAGAVPGPACYGRGGEDVAVTDANVVLGIVDADSFLGGEHKGDSEASFRALSRLGERYLMSAVQMAEGVYRIVSANMAFAVRNVTVKKGLDPREFTLVPFGGAGGQHAVAVAKELGIRRILVPRSPATFSAFGSLVADIQLTRSRSLIRPLAEEGVLELMTEGFEQLEKETLERLRESVADFADVSVERTATMRYIGQVNEIAVPIKAAHKTAGDIYSEFQGVYNTTYGLSLDDPVEVIDLQATVIKRRDKPVLHELNSSPSSKPTPRTHRKTAFYDELVPVYTREELSPGAQLAGPCLVEEYDSTLFLTDECVATVDPIGNILVTLGD